MRRAFLSSGKSFRLVSWIGLLLALTPRTAVSQSATVYSVILSGGTIHDGLGSPPVMADLGLVGDRIAAVGDLSAERAAIRIDARGLAIAPGFIDIHSHGDGDDAETSSLGRRPLAENYLRQGVTSFLGGQDGSSPLDLASFLAYFDALKPAVNVGMFVGHGSIRAAVVGEADRPPTSDELARMRTQVARAMEDGAFGLSSGLEYTPGAFAETGELIELARVIAPFGGIYISHVREEGGRLMESVDEVIRIAREAGVPGQLTHHKIIGKGRWGGTSLSLAAAAAARADGVDITLDVYPYTASSTDFTILFPTWAKDGGFEALRQRLATPETRRRIRDDVIRHIEIERGGDPSTIVAARCAFDPELSGLSLAEMARRQGLEPTVPVAADLAISLVERGSCQGVFHSMSEEDVQRVMRDEGSMIASDGGIPAFGVDMPHPRGYGTFARVLGRYVREWGVLTLPEAIRKMTSAPALRLGLPGRGVLREGAIADVVVFDPATIADQATFTDPHRYATGVRHVFVAGAWALRDGEPTGVRAGRALRKTRPDY